MSYNNQMNEVTLGVDTSIVPADPIATARWSPSYNPQVVRAVTALITVQTASAIITLTWKFRPLVGSATGEVVLATLTIPIGAVVGAMYYKDVVAQNRIMPGGEVVVQAAGAGTGSARLGMSVYPSWEHPDNNAKMIASA